MSTHVKFKAFFDTINYSQNKKNKCSKMYVFSSFLQVFSKGVRKNILDTFIEMFVLDTKHNALFFEH